MPRFYVPYTAEVRNLAHPVRERRLDLGELPRRGAWGSQTEKNFPIAVGQAIALAIAEEYAKWPGAANA